MYVDAGEQVLASAQVLGGVRGIAAEEARAAQKVLDKLQQFGYAKFARLGDGVAESAQSG